MRRIFAPLAAFALAAACAAAASALEIRSDMRVDLIGLLQQLSGDNAFQRSEALARTLREFEPFRSHPAVQRMALMRGRGFKGNIPGQYAVYLSTGPDLRETYPAPEFFAGKAGGAEQLRLFLKEAGDFVRDTRFASWHAARGEEAARLNGALRESIAGVDLEGPLVRYLGLRSWASWVMVPSVFYRPGVTSSWILEEKPGLPDIFVILGPNSEGDKRAFGDAATLAEGIWSEPLFSTAYVMVELCRPQLQPVKGLCDERWDVSDSESCFEKRWVDAIKARLGKTVFGDGWRSGPEEPLRSEIGRGVDSALIDYESHRQAHTDMIGSTAMLAAPMQRGGLPPDCLLIDEGRFQEALYARRLAWYLDMRLARKPEPELLSVRSRLRKARLGPSGR